jgi:hypothetical protein
MTKNRARRVAIFVGQLSTAECESKARKEGKKEKVKWERRRRKKKRKKKDKGWAKKERKLGPPINDQIMGSLDTHPHMAAAELFRSA